MILLRRIDMSLMLSTKNGRRIPGMGVIASFHASFLASFLLLLGVFVVPPTARLSAQSRGDDTIMKAMSDELARSMTNLKMENVEKPYYLDYSIIDEEALVIKASFGGVKIFDHGRHRYLKTSIRVGAYELDNTNFIPFSAGRGGMPLGMRGPQTITIENDYDGIRRAIWISTDEAYKEALETLSKKRAYVRNLNQTDQPASFSKVAEPAVITFPDIKVQWNDDAWKKACVDLSNVFRKFPLINDSEVSFALRLQKKYFVSSEGTKTIEPQCLTSLEVRAATQSSDGMKLKDLISFAASVPEELPPTADVKRETERMARELSDLRDASVISDYSGPAILTGEASAEFFRQLLGENLCGRAPLIAENKMFETLFKSKESAFRGKADMAVLPGFFDVWADPQQVRFEGKPLVGAYHIDDEGVPARKAQLVEKGILKDFMMSRTPTKDFSGSNGHGRGFVFGKPEARISNILIQASDGKSLEELKKAMLDLCRQQNKPYGVLISAMERPGESDESENAYAMGGVQGGEERLLSKPMVAYQVFADGTEKMIRGLDFSNVTVRILKDILAASRDGFVYNFPSTDAPQMVRQWGFMAGIGSSIVAPTILVEEMDMKKVESMQEKPPFLKHPYFR
jgi:TldD protein